jgi:hypothetical protein
MIWEYSIFVDIVVLSVRWRRAAMWIEFMPLPMCHALRSELHLVLMFVFDAHRRFVPPMKSTLRLAGRQRAQAGAHIDLDLACRTSTRIAILT